ncbi:MAG: hypothetical protein IRZ14_09920 [Chloroflexi bacterium]|nr:hypothetical protein [Chloroflexota bacterium]
MARFHGGVGWLAALIVGVGSVLAPPALALPVAQDPSAPPAPLCPEAVGCTYVEHRPYPAEVVWRFQSLTVCGANCSARYWVTDVTTNRVVLGTPEVRGGGIVAMARSTGGARRPAIRTILPDPEPTDGGCCPSYYRDTVYGWDPAQGQLVAEQSRRYPTASFPGWEALRRTLDGEGFDLVFGD